MTTTAAAGVPDPARVARDTYRVAVDTGGTFTDVAAMCPDGSVAVWKVASQPAAPDEAVRVGLAETLDRLGADAGQVVRFLHGTTVATNALLTRTGASVGLVVTEGFRDLLAIGRQTRPALYDLSARRPEALVASDSTWEVAERTAADGSIDMAVDDGAVAALAREMRDARLDVVVVSLLNSYRNPAHERQVAAALREADVAPLVFAATDVSPEMGEYERTSTAVLNGYVQPAIAAYLGRLEEGLTEIGLGSRLWVMQSNGGLLGAATAREQSVRTVLSGLAGGVMGAARWATDLELPRVVSLDMGGTSTDIALVRDGRPDEMTSGEVGGYAIRLPAVDVHTIGAGGGSLAWQDTGGNLRVGPRSAGADPGPVCYRRGGDQLTVTDANLLLGRLGSSLLDGRLDLDVDGAAAGLDRLADVVGLPADDTAAGIVSVVNATMARGIRKVSVERGVDVRDCVLMAFGGAGPLHAADLVDELGMRGAVVPPHPGIASAIGMLDAPVRHDLAASVSATAAADLPAVAAALDDLTDRAVRFLTEVEDLPSEQLVTSWHVDARYLGQSYDLTVDWRPSLDELRALFDAAHAERHGFADRDATLELVAARVTVTAPPADDGGPRPPERPGGAAIPVGKRRAYFAGCWHDAQVYRREQLPAGATVVGPAIIEQLDSTVVVGVGQQCLQDGSGFLHLFAEAP